MQNKKFLPLSGTSRPVRNPYHFMSEHRQITTSPSVPFCSYLLVFVLLFVQTVCVSAGPRFRLFWPGTNTFKSDALDLITSVLAWYW
jgi:hypothetical protein